MSACLTETPQRLLCGLASVGMSRCACLVSLASCVTCTGFSSLALVASLECGLCPCVGFALPLLAVRWARPQLYDSCLGSHELFKLCRVDHQT